MPLTSACCRPPALHGQAGPGADSEPCQDIFGTSFQQPAWPKIRQNAPLIGNADPTATRSRASCDTSAHRSRQHLRSTFTQRKPPGPGLPSTSTATSSSAGHPSQHPHVTRTARSPQRSPLPQRRLLLPSQGAPPAGPAPPRPALFPPIPPPPAVGPRAIPLSRPSAAPLRTFPSLLAARPFPGRLRL